MLSFATIPLALLLRVAALRILILSGAVEGVASVLMVTPVTASSFVVSACIEKAAETFFFATLVVLGLACGLAVFKESPATASVGPASAAGMDWRRCLPDPGSVGKDAAGEVSVDRTRSDDACDGEVLRCDVFDRVLGGMERSTPIMTGLHGRPVETLRIDDTRLSVLRRHAVDDRSAVKRHIDRFRQMSKAGGSRVSDEKRNLGSQMMARSRTVNSLLSQKCLKINENRRAALARAHR